MAIVSKERCSWHKRIGNWLKMNAAEPERK
jgi:hypothetical protein